MPRPKGIPNKRSQLLLRKLENDHKFYVAKELVEIYGYNKQILCELVNKIQDNIDNDRSPLNGFSDDEVTLYNTTNKEVLNTLVRMLAYLYPKLKSMEVGTGTGEKITFNISTLPAIHQPAPQAQETTSDNVVNFK